MIAILRDPVERAYSAFLYMRRDGREPISVFSETLKAEEDRIANDWEWIWHYKNVGFYYAQLRRYFDIFDQVQIKVFLYEDLKANPLRMVRDVFRFLGVDSSFNPDTSSKHNVSGVPRNRAISWLLFKRNPVKATLKPLIPEGMRQRVSESLKSRSLLKAPPLAPDVRRELREVYRDDILKLEGLIGRDLSKWLQG